MARVQEAGVVEESEGAQVIWTRDDREKHPPLFMQKSDGGFGYARYAAAL